MKKQLVAAIVAIVLAVVGVLSLVSYAQGADDRAYRGAELVEVLQLRADVPAGTPAERLRKSVDLVKIPIAAKVDGALATLDDVESMSTNVALSEGEQLLKARFGAVATETKSDSSLPEGMQEVSVAMSGARMPTGKLKPGDRVGVVTSYADSEGKGDAGYTNVAANRVLVTKVASATAAEGGDGSSASLVTLAVKTIDAEKIINASEFGKVWLTLQGNDTDTGGGRMLSGKDVLK